MTDNNILQNKLVEILDQVQNGVVEIGGQAVKYAPEVTDAVLWVVRINGLQDLIFGILAIIPLYFCYKIISKYIKKEDEKNYPEYVVPQIIFPGVFGIVCFFVLCIGPLNVWTYAEIFQPKIYLAHALVQKVLIPSTFDKK